jgi:hypothetical protein
VCIAIDNLAKIQTSEPSTETDPID